MLELKGYAFPYLRQCHNGLLGTTKTWPINGAKYESSWGSSKGLQINSQGQTQYRLPALYINLAVVFDLASGEGVGKASVVVL